MTQTDADIARADSDSAAGSLPAEDVAALRAIVEGTAQGTGQAFFESLVRQMSAALGARYAFIAEFVRPPELRARTIAYWSRDRIASNFEWDLRGTPCEDVVRGNLCHHPSNVAKLFPADTALAEMGIQSYLGVPLRDRDGNTLGHLAIFDDRPMPEEPRRVAIFRIFAARAASELQRLGAERMLSESETRYRDLYEEAPIAYVYEDVDSRFIRANRAACRLLGLRPEEVAGTFGKSLLAPVPQVQQRIAEALAAMKSQKKEFTGIELELRRKDNGQPVWVQWYSKPDPDGQHTRTMLIDITERVLMEREKARLEQQNQYLQEEIKSVHNFDEIVGRSAKLIEVLEKVRRVAPTDASVLILGETGTGKELIARAIHSASNRARKPLIKVNCAALPTGLVESELFGHERGAFSGAIGRRVGRFELAHGGTIFLDEIGEVPLEVQVKLLRVLQEKEFERVGGAVAIKSDVRIIAATNRDLSKAVRAGTFREDLFYRLNVFPVHVPPLRDRSDDIPLLVQFLLSKFSAQLGKRIEGVTPETMRRLTDYPWPGNVRELENVLERACILATERLVEVMLDMRDPPADHASPAAPSSKTLEEVERNHLLSVLRSHNWVIDGPSGAARVLDLHPNTLRSRLKKFGISRASHAIS